MIVAACGGVGGGNANDPSTDAGLIDTLLGAMRDVVAPLQDAKASTDAGVDGGSACSCPLPPLVVTLPCNYQTVTSGPFPGSAAVYQLPGKTIATELGITAFRSSTLAPTDAPYLVVDGGASYSAQTYPATVFFANGSVAVSCASDETVTFVIPQ